MYEGIPSQTVARAIRSCLGYIETDRLLMAADEARTQGLILPHEQQELHRMLHERKESCLKEALQQTAP